jgi:hypothetical protein
LANFPVAYCGLKIITSLRSVSLIFSEGTSAKELADVIITDAVLSERVFVL